MSEKAIQYVEAQGEKLFATSSEHETPRWARSDLSSELVGPGRSAEALSALLAVNKDQMRDWIGGRAAMPEKIQAVLAGIVGKPPREIFTDIPPP
jgi:hypothetical protein